MKRILLLLAVCSCSLFAQNPAITEVLNNYGLINAGTVAQGAIFIVKGTNLADLDKQTTTLQEVPLQTNLKNVQIRLTVGSTVTFAPLYYALNTQLAGILPSNTPTGTANLVVINNGKNSPNFRVTIVKSAFGMLTLNGSGAGAAAVHDQNYFLLSNSNATNPGKAVVFYGSGLGPVTGVETTTQTQVDMTTIPITVDIGGKPAQVLYRGRTVYPGLDQINIVIPTLDAAAYGCNVPVIITTNGVQANVGTIPVASTGSNCPVPSGGGGNSGVQTTQEEVNRWINAGGYTTGGPSVGRSTSYSIDDTNGGAVTITKQDSVSAQFTRISGQDLGKMLRGELPQSYNQYLPSLNSCIVYNTIPSDPYPLITRTYLDAGPAIVANGPSGVAVATKSTQFINGISYSALNLPNTYANAGNYTFTGSGGPDVGAFTSGLEVYPDLVVLNSPDDFRTINRSSSITVRWNGGDPQTNVQVSGTSYVVSSTGAPIGSPTVFLCLVPNTAGQFTVPSSILGQLPASTSYSINIGNNTSLTFLARGSISVSQASRGNRITIPNIDYGVSANSWGWAYSPKYQ